jgi:hypothetical protein
LDTHRKVDRKGFISGPTINFSSRKQLLGLTTPKASEHLLQVAQEEFIIKPPGMILNRNDMILNRNDTSV